MSKKVDITAAREEDAVGDVGVKITGTVIERVFQVHSDEWKESGLKPLRGTLLIDFSNLTQERILELASASMVITFQRKLRTMDRDFVTAMLKNPVKEFAENLGRKPVDPNISVNNILGNVEKLTPEARIQLLNELQASAKAQEKKKK